SFGRQIRFWLIVAVGFVGFLWLFSEILLPFAAGMILAYFLDPVADWLQRRGLSRLMATNVILVGFIVVLALAIIIVVPLLISQLKDFAQNLPGYIEDLQTLIANFDMTWLEHLGFKSEDLRGWLSGALSN